MTFLLLVTMLVVLCPSNTMAKMACSLVELREMQIEFTTCSRMKIEEHQNLEGENPCQLVRKVIRTCGALWQKCHTSMEVRRMRDLHIEALVRQYGADAELDGCGIVTEYRSASLRSNQLRLIRVDHHFPNQDTFCS